MDPKSLLKSKTFWFAVIFGLVNIAGIFGYATYQPDANTTEIVGVVVSVIIVILRLVTSQAIGSPKPPA